MLLQSIFTRAVAQLPPPITAMFFILLFFHLYFSSAILHQKTMYSCGSIAFPLYHNSKCRWGPLVCSPELPITAMASPAFTNCPAFFNSTEQCLYADTRLFVC